MCLNCMNQYADVVTMLENEDIICVSYSTWEGPYTKSTVQLMSLLALKNRMLYVEYPFTLKDLITSLLGKQNAPVGRMLGLKKRAVVKTTTEGAKVVQWILPPLIPLRALKNDRLYHFLLKINGFIYKHSLKKAIKKLKFSQPVIINAYNPVYGEVLLGKLNEKATIYYCFDGFFKDRKGIRAWHADRSYASKVDGVIVTSSHLQLLKAELNSHIGLVKNGVDFELFNKAAKEKVSPGTRKKIGYIGSIDQRFDINIVEYAIGKLINCDWEITGDLRNQKVKERLDRYENVRFNPPVTSDEVPGIVGNCDVGIIPYLCDEINKNIYPLKINEYLAVGVPMVVTRFADLSDFTGYASFATTKEEFLECLRYEIQYDTIDKIRSRIEFAKANSWKSRAQLFNDYMYEFIYKKQQANEN
jgi:teichuronic acid biosynthesis glycosyltransferase TuaH